MCVYSACTVACDGVDELLVDKFDARVPYRTQMELFVYAAGVNFKLVSICIF